MKKVIRLTESDLTRIIKRVIKEEENSQEEDVIQQGLDLLNSKIPRLRKEKKQSRRGFDITHYIDKRGEEYIRHVDQSSSVYPKGTSGIVTLLQPVGDVLSTLGLDSESEEMEVILKKWLEDNYGFIDPTPVPEFTYKSERY
jgi:hypothetical protein